MPRNRCVGETLLRQEAVKILRPHQMRNETGTNPTSGPRVHLCRTGPFAVLSGYSDLFGSAYRNTCYRASPSLSSEKKGTNLKHLKNG